jgi:hypothetical protein
MFAAMNTTKQIMYAGLRPALSEKAPMNVGAMPWRILREWLVRV